MSMIEWGTQNFVGLGGETDFSVLIPAQVDRDYRAIATLFSADGAPLAAWLVSDKQLGHFVVSFPIPAPPPDGVNFTIDWLILR